MTAGSFPQSPQFPARKSVKKFFLLLWRGWKKFAHALGVVNTTILLTLTYFGIMAICSIISRLLGSDLLDKRLKPKPSYWCDREPDEITLETCRRQF